MEAKKILVAVDLSEWASNTVEYVASIMPSDTEVTIFHVMASIPESFWDQENKPLSRLRFEELQSWDVTHRKALEDHFEQHAEILTSKGFQRSNIKIVVRPVQVGIARDIIYEAQKGYNGLFVGRRGTSRLKDIIMGSTSSKLLNTLSSVPLWVVGEKAAGKGIVVGVDSSEESMKAVKYMASVMEGRKDWSLFLLHVVRALELLTVTYDPFFAQSERVEWMRRLEQQHLEDIRAKMGDFFDRAEAVLREAGLKKGQIHTEIITGSFSRAATLIEESRKRNCSTIIVGRRGLSRVEEFFMGRVSGKILQLSVDKTVCIVG